MYRSNFNYHIGNDAALGEWAVFAVYVVVCLKDFISKGDMFVSAMMGGTFLLLYIAEMYRYRNVASRIAADADSDIRALNKRIRELELEIRDLTYKS